MTPTPRRGFTLVELLVATAVFVIGFAAVFALFLSGVRFRKLADDTTLTATLTSSLLTEIYLDSGRLDGTAPSGPPGPAEPQQYDNDGRGTTSTVGQWEDTPLYAYAGVPGTEYRIAGPPPQASPGGTANGSGHCCDVTGGQDPFATTVIADVIALCPGTPVPTLGDLERRVRLVTSSSKPTGWSSVSQADDQAIVYENELVARGIALRYRAAMVRRPHWMP